MLRFRKWILKEAFPSQLKYVIYVRLQSFALHCTVILQERKFIEEQEHSIEESIQSVTEQHRQKVALLERQLLEQQQQLKKGL